ncbi:MAG: gamma-glutamyl-gamma-aminobutyrate hydrolase family protein [Thermoleophilia bacterium]|nr:gamma-glutamyl-gamma-aminobutyrate hydrolase family protein [Thermoleophilia bacterium]
MRRRALFVITEHPAWLTQTRVDGYERIRRDLEEVAQGPVQSVHYLDGRALDADAVVLSGAKAPWAAQDRRGLERLGEAVLAYDRPVLGICAGLQLLAMFAGGEVRPLADAGRVPERGYMPLEVLDEDGLLRGLGPVATVFQDHEDEILDLPVGFRLLARTPGCAIQAVEAAERRWWGTQFHPERSDPAHPDGKRVLRNFFRLARRG